MQWITIGLIAALVAGLVTGVFVSNGLQGPIVPVLSMDASTQVQFNSYRSILARSGIVSRGYAELPSPIDTIIPGHLLYVDRRLSEKKSVTIVREYYQDPVDAVYPVAIIFDTNSDGIFSLNEGYLVNGDPLYVGVTPLQVVATGIEGAANASKENQ